MLTDALLAALLLYLVIMCFDHRKWRRALTVSITESATNGTSILGQATDHLAFIADCMEDFPEQTAGHSVAPAVDFKSIITQALMSRVMMEPDDSYGSEAEQSRKISEKSQQTTPDSQADD